MVQESEFCFILGPQNDVEASPTRTCRINFPWMRKDATNNIIHRCTVPNIRGKTLDAFYRNKFCHLIPECIIVQVEQAMHYCQTISTSLLVFCMFIVNIYSSVVRSMVLRNMIPDSMILFRKKICSYSASFFFSMSCNC